jgi:DNA mismatch endonuclease (patch repair protein)
MQANRRRDTRPELLIRRRLHRAGLRYRCDLRIDLPGTLVRPDIVFTRARVALFIDGCFWHSCPIHGIEPRTNSSYWSPKLQRNRERDAANSAALIDAGWLVVRAWEHEDPDDVVDSFIPLVRSRY